MESVMDMAQGFLGGDMLSRVSSWLHESPAGTKAAMQDALPVSVLGLANQAQSEEGSRALLGRFQRGDYPHLEADELGRAVTDPETTDRLVQSNRGFTEGMFGGKLGRSSTAWPSTPASARRRSPRCSRWRRRSCSA